MSTRAFFIPSVNLMGAGCLNQNDEGEHAGCLNHGTPCSLTLGVRG